MPELRGLQLASSVAFLVLGIAAVVAAVRWPERARVDVALLFGAIGLAVLLQEGPRLAGVAVPGGTQALLVLILALPYLLLRLVDNLEDVPRWLRWGVLALFAGLSGALVLAPAPLPPALSIAAVAYLVGGMLYAGWAFVRRAWRTTGITARRMWAIAAGCGLLAAVFLAALGGLAGPEARALGSAMGQVLALASVMSFWLGFFPPAFLRSAWRVPELFDYLRSSQPGRDDLALDPGRAHALAVERLLAATTRTLGARRVLLVLEDPGQADGASVWGAPTARLARGEGIVGRVLQTGEPLLVRRVQPADLPPAVRASLGKQLPRAALVVPVLLEGRVVGALGAYADKGPIFVEDDLEVLRFFAGELAGLLRTRQLRQATRELAALHEADRLKDEFMAIVSHELRTPLTAISGYADILLRQVAGPLTERQERQVVGVRDAARRLLALINDLLDVSKLQSGDVVLRRERTDVQEVLQRCVADTQVLASARGIELRVEEPAADEPLPPVFADPERLQQVVVNLLSNAIKFTPQGGEVVVRAWRESGPVDEPVVAFSVADTGIGLAADELPRIWGRFYQADSSSTRRFGGTGLGLSIVQRLVHLHRGTVEARSAGPDQGSTFTVRLPAIAEGEAAKEGAAAEGGAQAPERRADGGDHPAPSPAAAPAAAAPARAEPEQVGPPLVLVIDDDPDIAAILATSLQAEGYGTVVAADGQAALALARAEHPFAITLDVMLPKLDGWSVLHALKRDPTTASIPVVLVSIVDNRDFGLMLGATDYLVKPLDLERFRSAIGRLASGRAAPRAAAAPGAAPA